MEQPQLLSSIIVLRGSATVPVDGYMRFRSAYSLIHKQCVCLHDMEEQKSSVLDVFAIVVPLRGLCGQLC